MLPTLLAIAGDTQVKDKLLQGYRIGDMTYKVHLDGDNLVPYLTGQVKKSPRESFLYINDDQQLVGLRYDKKNEHLIFGKTNPIRADEGASRPLHLGAPGADGLSKVFLNTNLNGQATCGDLRP